jgi:hypothetical protein
MKKFYPALLLLTVACSPKLVYVGDKAAPSSHIEVFVDAENIKKPYHVVGVITPDLTAVWFPANYDEKIARKAVEKAKQYGADAVLFSNYYLKPEGGGISRESKTVYSDTSVNNNTTVSRTIPASSTGRQILFLKYK